MADLDTVNEHVDESLATLVKQIKMEKKATLMRSIRTSIADDCDNMEKVKKIRRILMKEPGKKKRSEEEI